MDTQTYQNHTRRVPGFLALFYGIAITFIGAAVNLYQSIGDHQRLYSASLIIVLAFSVLAVAYYARIFALKAQDRAIRAEENLRHFILTGQRLDPRLTIQQIIALRFAGDGEFPALASQAAEQNTSAAAIKQQVKDWRADFHRV